MIYPQKLYVIYIYIHNVYINLLINQLIKQIINYWIAWLYFVAYIYIYTFTYIYIYTDTHTHVTHTPHTHIPRSDVCFLWTSNIWDEAGFQQKQPGIVDGMYYINIINIYIYIRMYHSKWRVFSSGFLKPWFAERIHWATDECWLWHCESVSMV